MLTAHTLLLAFAAIFFPILPSLLLLTQLPSPTLGQLQQPLLGSSFFYTLHNDAKNCTNPPYGLRHQVYYDGNARKKFTQLRLCLQEIGGSYFSLVCKINPAGKFTLSKSTYAATDPTCSATPLTNSIFLHDNTCRHDNLLGGWIRAHCGEDSYRGELMDRQKVEFPRLFSHPTCINPEGGPPLRKMKWLDVCTPQISKTSTGYTLLYNYIVTALRLTPTLQLRLRKFDKGDLTCSKQITYQKTHTYAQTDIDGACLPEPLFPEMYYLNTASGATFAVVPGTSGDGFASFAVYFDGTAKTLQPTGVPTPSPSRPSALPSAVPSAELDISPDPPLAAPSPSLPGEELSTPISDPTPDPTPLPSPAPTSAPTLVPSTTPTPLPSPGPSNAPVAIPTFAPSLPGDTSAPIPDPTPAPSALPTATPSTLPTFEPSALPSPSPSALPSLAPSALPTPVPSTLPTFAPSAEPSVAPSPFPSAAPTPTPTVLGPTASPTPRPTNPTGQPSRQPTRQPTGQPTSQPSRQPSAQPTIAPSQNTFGVISNTIMAKSNVASGVGGGSGDTCISAASNVVMYDQHAVGSRYTLKWASDGSLAVYAPYNGVDGVTLVTRWNFAQNLGGTQNYMVYECGPSGRTTSTTNFKLCVGSDGNLVPYCSATSDKLALRAGLTIYATFRTGFGASLQSDSNGCFYMGQEGKRALYYDKYSSGGLQPGTAAPYTYNTLPGYILYTLPGYILYTLPGYILYTLPGYILYTLPGYILYTLPGYILYTLPGYILWCPPSVYTYPRALLSTSWQANENGFCLASWYTPTWYAPDGQRHLVFKQDVLAYYLGSATGSATNFQTGTKLWDAWYYTNDGARLDQMLCMQDDGNLVIYSAQDTTKPWLASGTPLYATGVFATARGAYSLYMDNMGCLFISVTSSTARYSTATGTSGKQLNKPSGTLYCQGDPTPAPSPNPTTKPTPVPSVASYSLNPNSAWTMTTKSTGTSAITLGIKASSSAACSITQVKWVNPPSTYTPASTAPTTVGVWSSTGTLLGSQSITGAVLSTTAATGVNVLTLTTPISAGASFTVAAFFPSGSYIYTTTSVPATTIGPITSISTPYVYSATFGNPTLIFGTNGNNYGIDFTLYCS